VNPVVSSAVARVASFVPTAVATLLTTRLIIDHYGVAVFDSFAVILALINLVPLNNLGVGAAVTSAYARADDRGGAERTLLTATRVLILSTIGTAAASLVLSALGWWPALLGGSSGPNLWCGLALVAYALSFVPGLGQSMLLGLHRNHLTIAVQAFYNPLVLAIVAGLVVAGVHGPAVMLAPGLGLVVVNLVTGSLAARLTRTSWARVLARVPARRRFPGASIRALSGPVLIITLSTPIALQSDRIVLSHVASRQAVADYSVAMQIFAPALALIAASAQPLWPIYTRARSEGRRGPAVLRVFGLFCAVGAAIGGVLALLAGPAARLIAGDHVHVSPLLALAGALGVLTAAASYPIAMSLMYPEGMRFVVWCTVLAVPLNIALSVVLGHAMGAPGPLFASVIAGLGVQAVPCLFFSRDRQEAGRHRRSRYRPPHLLERPVLALPSAVSSASD